MAGKKKNELFRKYLPVLIFDAVALIITIIMITVVRGVLISGDDTSKAAGAGLFNTMMSIISVVIMIGLNVVILVGYRRVDKVVSEKTNDLVISLETQKRRLDIIGALADIYTCAFCIDLEDYYYRELSSVDYIQSYIAREGDAREAIEKWLHAGVSDDERDKMRAFADLDTVADRLGDEKIISEVFLGQIAMGMSRASFIVVNRDDDGIPTRVVFAIQYVDTEFRKEQNSELEIEEAIEKANRAITEKNRFLINLSKNMSTPINGILTLTGIGMTHSDDKDRVEGTIEKIEDTAHALMDYTKEIINLTRVDEGKKSLANEKFDIEDFARDFADRARERAMLKEQQFIIDNLEIENRYVMGDMTKLNQVFMSLFNKNMRYTPDGGNIHFSLTERPSRHRGYCCYDLQLRDDGMGMTESFLAMVFENDTRGNAEYGSDESSILTLNSVRNITRMMEGDLTIQSEQKVGTKYMATFYLKKAVFK